MANIKIAQLTNKTTLADTDIIIVETATATEKMTIGLFKTLLGIFKGGVVESGSNANGQYVKYADGVCIAQHRAIFNGVNIAANAWTGGFEWIKPVDFTNKNTSGYSEFSSFAGVSPTGNPIPMVSTKAGWIGANFIHQGVNFSTGPLTDYYIDLYAIGRWK